MVSADPIVVVLYDEAWPSPFEEERARIERAIGPWVEEIAHVGSPAVPGLAAKPVIDSMVCVRSLGDSPILVGRLVGIGYEYVPEFERVVPLRRYLRKMREGRRTHQIHLVERSTPSGGSPPALPRLPAGESRGCGRIRSSQVRALGQLRRNRVAYTDAKTDSISGVVRRAQENERS